VQAEADGWRMTITPNDNAADARELHYDAQLRPLRLVQPDNSTTQWEYLADRTRTITTSPDGTYVCSTLSADGRQRVIENADRAQMLQKFDEDGMLTQVDLDGQKIFSLQWHPSGQLSSLDFDTHSVVLAYDDAGRVAKIQQVCWSDNKKGHVLAEETLNGDGRVSEIKDDSGADIHVAVDPGGNLTGLSCKWDGNDWQINVTNTSDGRITRVQSPWGSGTFTYAVDRSLSQVKLEKEQAIATVEYEQGRIKTITQFDQGKIRFDYYSGGELQGRLKTLQTSAIKVGYAYRPDGRLQSVDCGQSARVSYNYDGPGNVQRVEWTPLQPQCQEK
jgi:YD repeat-containing protein